MKLLLFLTFNLLWSLAGVAADNRAIDSLNRIAVEDWNAGNYQRALDHVTKAYNLAKEEKGEKLALVLNTLGLVYWRLGNNDDAMQSYIQSADIAERLRMKRLQGLVHTNMALIYKEQGSFDEAFLHNRIAINIFRELKEYRDLGIAYNNHGQIFKNMGRIDSAKACYYMALTNYKLIGYNDGTAATWYNIADICLKTGRMKESLDAGYKSLSYSVESGSKIRISEAYHKLAQAWEQSGNSDSALSYFKKYNELNTSIMLLNQSNRLAKFQAELGAEVKNLQIENLRKEKALATNRIWLTGISALILILIAAFFAYRWIEKIRFRKEYLERELSNSARILEVKEQELKAYIIDLTRKNNIITRLQEERVIADASLLMQATPYGKSGNQQENPVPTGQETEQLETDPSRVEQLLEQKILTNDDWTIYKSKFKSIYPGFFTRIRQSGVALTEAEERLLVLVYLDLSSREMANTLGISNQSVRVCKMRMKKKLLEKGFNSVEEYLNTLTK